MKDLGKSTKAYAAIGLLPGAKMGLPAIGARAQEIQVGDGSVLLVTPDAPGGSTDKFITDRGESMMGISVEVESLEQARAVLKDRLHRDVAVYSGPFGKSVLVPAELAAGAWFEFFEKVK